MPKKPVKTNPDALRERLDNAAKELHTLDGDIAVLIVLSQNICEGLEVEANCSRLKNEVGLLKQRIIWDDAASEMGPQHALKIYGARP